MSRRLNDRSGVRAATCRGSARRACAGEAPRERRFSSLSLLLAGGFLRGRPLLLKEVGFDFVDLAVPPPPPLPPVPRCRRTNVVEVPIASPDRIRDPFVVGGHCSLLRSRRHVPPPFSCGGTRLSHCGLMLVAVYCISAKCQAA